MKDHTVFTSFTNVYYSFLDKYSQYKILILTSTLNINVCLQTYKTSVKFN